MIKGFSLILPCYNEGPTFERSFKRIFSEVKKLRRDFEIIFVEDKSNDDTRNVVDRLVKISPKIKAIYHAKNTGRGQTVVDGIKEAKFNFCGFLDVDCEVSPVYIKLFLAELDSGVDMVVGKRFYEKGFKSMTRFLSSKVYALSVKTLLGIPIEDTEAGFKFFNKRKILPVLKKVKDKGWFWDTEVCARAYLADLDISQVPVLFIRRSDKQTTVKLIRDGFDSVLKLFKFRSKIKKYL